MWSFRPFYSSYTTHPGVDILQDLYHPLFDKYGVDLVLQGHNHNYQRTYPPKYDQIKPFTPIITDRDTKEYKDPKELIFLTVRTAGEDLYEFTGQKPYIIEQLLLHGFLNVDVTDNGSNLTATFYENTEMRDIDRFSMVKEEIRYK